MIKLFGYAKNRRVLIIFPRRNSFLDAIVHRIDVHSCIAKAYSERGVYHR